MTDKILCPWCGAEMRASVAMLDVYGAIARYECSFCHACGPQRHGLQKEETSAAARAAAMRRYTPPFKPMTLEEVIAFDGEIWMEDKSDFDVWACRCFFNRAEKKMTVHYITMNTEVLEFSTYGKTWRCWSRKPTDEERGAAEWETN